ncbi:MAG: hypothetical protein Q4F23_04855 [Coriobacteriia bacterium]|nr:hypothetical protein [Coriobacteriia bacterium]
MKSKVFSFAIVSAVFVLSFGLFGCGSQQDGKDTSPGGKADVAQAENDAVQESLLTKEVAFESMTMKVPSSWKGQTSKSNNSGVGSAVFTSDSSKDSMNIYSGKDGMSVYYGRNMPDEAGSIRAAAALASLVMCPESNTKTTVEQLEEGKVEGGEYAIWNIRVKTKGETLKEKALLLGDGSEYSYAVLGFKCDGATLDDFVKTVSLS